MKIYSLAVIALSFAVSQGLKAQNTIEVQQLDAQSLQQEMANPDPLADATVLDEMMQIQNHGPGGPGHGPGGPGHIPGGPGHHGPPHYPGHGGYPPPPPPPPHHNPPPHHYPPPPPTPPSLLTCFTQDARGVVFRASSIFGNAVTLQDAALRQCYQNSSRPRTCVNLGCRYN